MRPLLLLALLGASAPTGARAASSASTPAGPAASAGPATAPAQGPDLELHVPRAEVKKVALEVENLQARLDLDTRVANFVQISAGLVATVQKLKVQLDDVAAETHLVVRLDRVTEVMSRALESIDRHPGLAGPGGSSAAVSTSATADPAAAATAAPQVPAASPEHPTGETP